MENTGLWIQKEGHKKKDSWHGLLNDREMSDEDSSKSQLKKLIKRSNSRRAIVVNAIQSQISKVLFKDLFFRRVHGLDNRIPKHVVSVDEKYIRRCLEFVHSTASNAAQCNIPVNSRATNMGTLSESLNALSESLNASRLFSGNACDSGHFIFECPVATDTGRVVISANAGDEWTLGTIMGSKSMINILNSSLLQQFGASDRSSRDNLNRMTFSDAEGLICYDFIDSPSGSSISSPYKLGKKKQLVQSHKYGSISVHKRLVSTSSTTSTCSDWLSSASSTLSQGMIQCTWKQGIPHFVFSADDQKEVYVAKLRKVDSADDKALDYVYQFHLNKGGKKSREVPESDLQLVGKMHVSTSFTLCKNNCRIMETQFTLFHNIEIIDKEMHTSEHSHRKNKGLSKKVSQVFRTSPSSKRKTLSRFGGSSAEAESCPWEPHALEGTNLLESDVPPNFEMAAIVVKDHLPCKRPEKVGGWGLKFLNKSGVNQTKLPSESRNQNNGDCSTSMSILIPAGLHGGPRTRNGGPSSLIERWRSGGRCECGGWDEGCPLTVLQRRSNKAEVMSQVDTQDECKSVELVTQKLVFDRTKPGEWTSGPSQQDTMAGSAMQAFLSLANELGEDATGQNVELAASILGKTTMPKQKKLDRIRKHARDEGEQDSTDFSQPKKTVPDYFSSQQPTDATKMAHVEVAKTTEGTKEVGVGDSSHVKAVATSVCDPSFDVNNDELESFFCCEGNLAYLDKADMGKVLRDCIRCWFEVS